jgi:hypothetical protein
MRLAGSTDPNPPAHDEEDSWPLKYPTQLEGQICEFKGSQRSIETFGEVPEMHPLVVFPHIKKSFDSEEVWMVDIVLPSIYCYWVLLPSSTFRLVMDSFDSIVE